MKRKRQYWCLLIFAGIMIVAYIQCCTVYAIVWAGFNGFGGIWMDYTEMGERITGGIVLFWFLLLLLFPVLQMIGHYKREEPANYYIYDAGFWILGIGAGILAFYVFRQPRQILMDGMVYVIRAAGWLEYPMP